MGRLPADPLFAPPPPVVTASFAMAWLTVARMLVARKQPVRSLTVHITDPTVMEPEFHARFDAASRALKLLRPRDVAYTIFPHHLYKRHECGTALYQAYNRPRGLYERVERRKPSWDGYFRRMTAYGPNHINQLDNVVKAIRSRKTVSTAAFQILIAEPGPETVRKMGAPCLNYVAVQLEARPRRLGLLCVYRNHDFLRKAYGNYWGLSNLLRFLCAETGFAPASLTCISARAYTHAPGVLKKLVSDFDAVAQAAIHTP